MPPLTRVFSMGIFLKIWSWNIISSFHTLIWTYAYQSYTWNSFSSCWHTEKEITYSHKTWKCRSWLPGLALSSPFQLWKQGLKIPEPCGANLCPFAEGEWIWDIYKKNQKGLGRKLRPRGVRRASALERGTLCARCSMMAPHCWKSLVHSIASTDMRTGRE